jgi:eukaryotic-like serine/threonine-protein kinase
MARESTFGTSPEQLKRLLWESLDGEEHESESGLQAVMSANGLMEQQGVRIGAYRLLCILGKGGIGVVYLAEQEQLIRRRVALKIIKPGMDSKRVLARFETERQALALLAHPNIAQVYDAGTADSGRPFFAMEYVKGAPITEFCDRHHLSIPERLQLFQQVCHALEHAHQKGIIHRDIKPSNILVTIENDQALPKIIDFGVAKAISQPLTEHTLVTEENQLLGTPEYMSPEQSELANEDIDTRSDIYSLGVLLYELLTGVLPFEPQKLRASGIESIQRMIRETDPKTPSTRLTELGDAGKRVTANRRTDISTLARCLHRELEWIPLKAMRKERSERYRSASEIADDIENYLQGNPLTAGPPSVRYRVRKFLRRHRALVVGVVSVSITLMAGFVVSTALYFQAEGLRVKAQQAAKQEAAARADAEAVCDLLQNDLIAAVSPGRSKGRVLTISSFLNVVSENLESKLKNMPAQEASIRATLGRTYRMLGKYKYAEQHLQRAYRLYHEHVGENQLETRKSLMCLAQVYGDRGRYEEARRIYTTLTNRNGMALMLMALGRYREAEQIWMEMLQTQARSQEQWLDTVVAPFVMGNLGELYTYEARYAEAEELLLKTLEDGTAQWGEESPYTLAYMSRLGAVYRAQGRYKEAETLLGRTLEISARVWGEREWHYATLHCKSELAQLYADLGRYDEAEPLDVMVLNTGRDTLGNEHRYTLLFIKRLAALYTVQSQYVKAEALFGEALRIGRQILGGDHSDTLETQQALIELYEAWGKTHKAEEWKEKLSVRG